MDKLTIKIVGPAGFGIKVTGMMLAKYFLRSDCFVFAYTEYPSLIRGGHNTFQVDIAKKEINSAAEKCNVLIALNKDSLIQELKNINTNALVIYDEQIENNFSLPKNINLLPAPLMEIAKNNGGDLMKNTVALGVLLGALDLSLEVLNKILAETFGHKGSMAEQNKKALQTGFEWIKNKQISSKNIIQFTGLINSQGPKQDNMFISGNQACALGAIAADCQLYSAYPMTPASEILHYLVSKQQESGMLVHQPEDEIAAVHVALGASFAGIRAACGTSGGGFALMNEGLSLSGMLELPLVIFEVMRPAPATGLPTWTEQGDLMYVVHGGHGDFPRLVLAPGNPSECFSLTQQAFNLADKYQIPAIVLFDKFLAESTYTVEKNIFSKIKKKSRGKILMLNQKQLTENKTLFARYKNEKDGVSLRPIPGILNGEYVANSDEHDEFGLTNESAISRTEQMKKRMCKMTNLKKEIPLPKIYGPKKAPVTLVCWGSTLGPALDAMYEINKAKTQINLIHFSYLWPLPLGLDKFLKQFKKLILVENNFSAQLGNLIRQETGIEIKDKILKYDGRPFWQEEIIKAIKK